MNTSEAPTEPIPAPETQPQIPPPSIIPTPVTLCVDDDDHMFTKRKQPAPKRKAASKKAPAAKKTKTEKQKLDAPARVSKQQPAMTLVEVEFLIESRLKRQNQFEGTIAKNDDIWKIITAEHNKKFNVARLFTSLRKRYSVETAQYREYYYECNKEWTGMSRDEKEEQSENVVRPTHADIFEKFNYNKRPLVIPETLYDGECDTCNFQQNPDGGDQTFGEEDAQVGQCGATK
ncbi:hypothetical protein CYMTET_24635 [Cymbomonas tetramitiformis]|uniref:Myb/SANT-like domain-containing protein n=1 Tax=Cymbomonas tetramitiformis TaxID=36881 RepID=A0AAE0FVH3_9CHLO|nr:hypothetical protein CYMTET_24635 [Cymbomonas tetramitiformis]